MYGSFPPDPRQEKIDDVNYMCALWIDYVNDYSYCFLYIYIHVHTYAAWVSVCAVLYKLNAYWNTSNRAGYTQFDCR